MKLFDVPAEATERVAPDNRKVADVFARLGYGFADAVADLVDNSVDAGASNVHVRFLRSSAGIHSVTIADDGLGMTAVELREAMRFGSRSEKTGKQLGKYGIGLKSASLSQADTVTVLTHRGGHWGGRRWRLPNVKKDWTCEILSSASVRDSLTPSIGAVDFADSGTVVVWEELEHLQALPANVDRVLTQTTKELVVELGIRFHRFLQDGRLAIAIDQQFLGRNATGITTQVTPLDPFSYTSAPRSDYPAALEFRVADQPVIVECHIWPAKSRAPGYKLGGGKVALRQGLYFYRNERVIQAGGWNKLRADDGEPHLSLARARIDLPAALDSLFKLDVTKSRLDPAPEFISGLLGAETAEGLTFIKYLDHAEKVYRRQKKKERANFPAVPGEGISKRAQRAIKGILKEPGTDPPARIDFKWSQLDHDELFRLDSERNRILLNRTFRRYIGGGSPNDAPMIKTLLMFLLQEDLGKAYLTTTARERIQRINQSLIASLKA